ncbi:hypothetical protein P7C70_g8226, partial [Phenoliferia sp. Uapishka_3]
MLQWLPKSIPEGYKGQKDWLSTVKVRNGGKGRFELDISRAPSALLSMPSPLHLTLLIGHFSTPTALKIPLGTFSFSEQLVASVGPEPALPAGWEVERFGKMKEIKWTWQEAEKRVGAGLSAAGLVVVLAPWVLFLGIIAHLSIPLSVSAPSSIIFLAFLSSFELLLVRFWLSDTMKLIPLIPVFLGIMLATALSGRRALGVLKMKREKAKKSQ